MSPFLAKVSSLIRSSMLGQDKIPVFQLFFQLICMPVATYTKNTVKESWRNGGGKYGRHHSQGHIRRYFLYRCWSAKERKKELEDPSAQCMRIRRSSQKPEASNGEKPPAARARTRSIMDARYILLPNNPGVLSMKIGYRWSFRTGMRTKISLKPRLRCLFECNPSKFHPKYINMNM